MSKEDKFWPRLGCFNPNWIRGDSDGEVRKVRPLGKDAPRSERKKVGRDLPLVSNEVRK